MAFNTRDRVIKTVVAGRRSVIHRRRRPVTNLFVRRRRWCRMFIVRIIR